jgi:hypothetical protein
MRNHATDQGGVTAAVLRVYAQVIVDADPLFGVESFHAEYEIARRWACAHRQFVAALLYAANSLRYESEKPEFRAYCEQAVCAMDLVKATDQASECA